MIEFIQQTFDWLSDPRVVISMLALLLSVYNTIKTRRAEHRIVKAKIHFLFASENYLLAAMTVFNPSSLPISITEMEVTVDNSRSKYKSEIFAKNFYRSNSKNNPQEKEKIYTAAFPIGIPPYCSQLVFVDFNYTGENEIDFVTAGYHNVNLAILTFKKVAHVKANIEVTNDGLTVLSKIGS